MKKHNLFKVVGIVILAYVILTWFVNASYFQGTLQGGVKAEVGLGYLINIPVQTLGYFSYIFVFILAVGAFYELLNATGKVITFFISISDLIASTKFLPWISGIFLICE